MSRPKNELYKKHLITEGKTEHGVYEMLLKDYRKKHKVAIAILQETGQEVANSRTFQIAASMVLKQMGVK